MAIVIQNPNIKTSRRSLTDNNKQTIGLKLPLKRGTEINGYFDSTVLTIEAVKENIRNLLLTRKGERVFNPELGVGLENLLFENINDELITLTEETIMTAIKKWLPFITVNKVNVAVNTENLYSDGITNQNTVKIDVVFFMNRTPNMLESVQILLQ